MAGLATPHPSARRIHRILRGLAPAAIVALGATSCATGTDAVAQGGSFDFVSPGGQTEIFYDPPETRGSIGTLAGPNLMKEGEHVSLDDYAGQVVVINLWGQWCAPCRAEADDLETSYEATRDLGVQFLGINVRDPQRDKAQDFVVDNQVTYPSIYDPPMRTLAALGGNYPTSVIPSTLVLDRQHRVAGVFLKALLADDLTPVHCHFPRRSGAYGITAISSGRRHDLPQQWRAAIRPTRGHLLIG